MIKFYYKCNDCKWVYEDGVEIKKCDKCNSTSLRKETYDTDDYVRHTPKCPTCQSTNLKKISGTKRLISTGLFGLASSNIGKTFECRSCGYKW